jgi:autotransporter-associated beta strand protein
MLILLTFFQKTSRIFCLVGFLTLVAAPLPAVVIRGGDASTNINAPADDPGWNNVGQTANGLSCVYLGNGWVLTAAHCRVGDSSEKATFNGFTSNLVGTSIRLHEVDNSNPVDLSLYQIGALPPGLTSLSISSETPIDGTTVTAMGFGKDRLGETFWNSSWQEGVSPAVYRGFNWASTRTKRWGENQISSSGYTINAGYGNNYAIQTIFDQTGGSGDNEFMVTEGDSGGSLFAKKNDEVWQLAGILEARSTFSGQPSSSAVYGNSSYAVDLSYYRDQIVAAVQVFQFASVLDNPQEVIGAGWQNAQLLGNGGFGASAGAFSLPVDLNGHQFTFQSGPNDIAYSGVLSGVGDLIVQGGSPGTSSVTLLGPSPNAYTGSTTVQSGLLVLNKPAGVLTIPSSQLTINSGAVLRTDSSQQINPNASLHLEGCFDLNNQVQTVGILSGTGGTIYLDTGSLKVNESGGSTFSGQIFGTGDFEKAGTGSLILNGYLKYSGHTTVSDGSLTVGDLVYSDEVTVGSGAQLQAQSIITQSLTIGAGAKVTIQPAAEGAQAGGFASVPEPSVFILLFTAGILGLGRWAAPRRRK